jgi:hypothetical protein
MSTGKFSFLRYVTLVVDSATSQIQAVVNAEGGSMSITAGWVNQLPCAASHTSGTCGHVQAPPSAAPSRPRHGT